MKQLDDRIRFAWHYAEGQAMRADRRSGASLTLRREVFSWDRRARKAALNFLQLLSSGVATATRRYVDLVTGTGGGRFWIRAKPCLGLRLAQKYAVRVSAAGRTSGWRYTTGVLIKENHIAAAGGIAPVLARRASATCRGNDTNSR